MAIVLAFLEPILDRYKSKYSILWFKKEEEF